MEFFKENKLISILIGGVILGLMFSFLRNTDQSVTNIPLTKSGPIVAFGDSLVVGVGSKTTLGGFVTRLENKLGIEIINEGVSGNTTRDGLKRLDKDVLSKNPKLVIVSLGGNDYLKRLPKEETASNLDQIVSKIHESGSAVILLGVKTGIVGDASKKMFREISEKHRPVYIENILGGIIFNDDLMTDTIHPNGAGYDIFADKIAPTLSQILR